MLTCRNKGAPRARRFIIGLCLFVATQVFADERILDYQSNVTIDLDGSMLVTETIRVRSEGNSIKKGIYRDFPTRYTDRYGNHYKVGLNVLDVRRDGVGEAFHTQKLSNGIRIYAGHPNRTLSAGVYDYSIRYQTNRQLGFFDDFDELYWNVTGNGWGFPIDRASVRVELPAPVADENLRIDFYTGPRGASGKDATFQIGSDRLVHFNTTRPLAPGEGLTIALGWPKGIVTEPDTSEKIGYFLRDNGAALVLLLGLLVPLGWYVWAWSRYGRDLRKGVIIPRFKPPENLTPAACSYIQKMAFTKQAFSAAVVSLGVKTYLQIQEDDDDFELRLKNATGNGEASPGEKKLLDALFNEDETVKLDQKNYKVFMKAKTELKKALKAEHLGRVFKLNSIYALPAVGMSVVAAIIASQMDGGPPVWITFAVLTLAMHAVFVSLMRAPTPAGRRIMDEIDGFRMYLDTAEQDRLDRMRSPELTPDVFETFLPYAFALGVENNWCDRFTREFPQDIDNKGGYHPAWYSGNRHGLSALGHLGSDFNNSFSSAISSASSPPGSSSGSGGGGSSGGGGGGGGGGGW